MDYLLKRGNRYYYNRRVPDPYREFDPRGLVRISLKTDCKKQAQRLAMQHNDQLELYWQKLLGSGSSHSHAQYQDAVVRAQALGFPYLPLQDITQMPVQQLAERILYLQKNNYVPAHVEAILGSVEKPQIKLDEALEKYFEIAKDKVLNKSPNQARKWYAPRKRAIRNLITCIGNKALPDLTRHDLLTFRDWWIERIKRNDLVANSANKDLIHVKTIVQTINDNLQLQLNTDFIFKKLLLEEDTEQTRMPFESDFIITHLLNPDRLKGLNEQAKWALYSIAETGAGLSEQVGLLPEDIILNCDIPHIIIRPRNKKLLKTKYRKRIIPLVGFALAAFKACPNGFTDYHDSPDRLSATIGKHLRENNLLPTEHHSVYSLRHSFQDRLLAVNAPDRVQADLMGHKFTRQSYGNGSTLKQKFEWMEKTKLCGIQPYSFSLLR